MNAHSHIDFDTHRVVTKIFGGLLGPEFIISVGGKSYRIGKPTLDQLNKGVPASEIDMLECDESGEPIDEAAS